MPETNVILISLDTLRPDHLGCYGYSKPTSPNLDAFCEESVVYEQVIAQAPSTLPSHASMFTSLLPHHHGASWEAKTRLPEGVLTLAEVLESAGYATAALAGGGQMDSVFGLDQGFDLYENPGSEDFRATVERGIEWIDQTPDRPFFLFLHSYEVHHPYDPEPADLEVMNEGYSGPLPDAIDIELLRQINRKEITIDEADLAHIIATYNAEIRSADAGFGLLVQALKDRDLYDSSLIIFTSDHGEEFGEHGAVGWHSHTLYDELLRVPLIIRFPGGELSGEVVRSQVRLMDVAPTVTTTVGLDPVAAFDGIDLGQVARAEMPVETIAISRRDKGSRQDLTSIRTERWKLIPPAMFDLERDPGEHGYTALRPDVLADLEEALEDALDRREIPEPEAVAPSEATFEELRALGYID